MLDIIPDLFRGHLFADKTALARAVVTALVRSGSVLDVTRLTNTAFHVHHPERDLERRIDPVAEPTLAAEWKRLRSELVMPLLAATPPDAPKRTSATTRTILLVGDSHTLGSFGVELARLLGTSDVRVERHAVKGSSVKTWLPRLPGLLRQHAPQTVIIALGANMRGYKSPEGTSKQIKRMIELVQREAPSARRFWIGPPRLREDTEATLQRFNGIIRAGLDGGTTFIDSAPHTPVYRGRDGEHYDPDAAKAWARGVFTHLGDR